MADTGGLRIAASVNELALFAGAGGGILGAHLLGWRTVCAVEWEPYAACVLAARQNDSLLPPFPIWDDIQTFDGRPWRGIVDVISGGFPCQDISVAGKGAGINGARSGMWGHMARVVGEVRPSFVFVENSPMLTSRGGTRVLGDLAALGYDTRWIVMGAADVGAPHQRDRIWVIAKSTNLRLQAQRSEQQTTRFTGICKEMADSDSLRKLQPQRSVSDQRRRLGDSSQSLANANRQRQQEQHPSTEPDQARQHPRSHASGWGGTWWSTEPSVGRVANGVAARVDRLKAIGNGQVPAVAAAAFKMMQL